MTALMPCAAACGRQLEAEDMVEVGGVLVCEPCHALIAKQADRRDSIDDAWRAAEATLPDGWAITGLTRFAETWGAFAGPPGQDPVTDGLVAFAEDPPRALRELARELHETYGSGVT